MYKVCRNKIQRTVGLPEEPKAMSVKLETVSFQMATVITVTSPFGSFTLTSFSCFRREEKGDRRRTVTGRRKKVESSEIGRM